MLASAFEEHRGNERTQFSNMQSWRGLYSIGLENRHSARLASPDAMRPSKEVCGNPAPVVRIHPQTLLKQENYHQEAIMEVRFAKENELSRINELRKQVNDLHVEGKTDVFKPGFGDELRDFINVIWNDPEQEIVVAVADGVICGFAIIHHINKPENPFMKERDFLDIDEFCVDEAYRRKGVATDLIRFIKEYAKENGFHRIELNMWEFNQGALAFYESVGFETYRRYMEIML